MYEYRESDEREHVDLQSSRDPYRHMGVPAEGELTKACTMAFITGGHLILELASHEALSTLEDVAEMEYVATERPLSNSELVSALDLMVRRMYDLPLFNIKITEDTTPNDILEVFRSAQVKSHPGGAFHLSGLLGDDGLLRDDEYAVEPSWRRPQMAVTLQDLDLASPLIQCALMEAIVHQCMPGEGTTGFYFEQPVLWIGIVQENQLSMLSDDFRDCFLLHCWLWNPFALPYEFLTLDDCEEMGKLLYEEKVHMEGVVKGYLRAMVIHTRCFDEHVLQGPSARATGELDKALRAAACIQWCFQKRGEAMLSGGLKENYPSPGLDYDVRYRAQHSPGLPSSTSERALRAIDSGGSSQWVDSQDGEEEIGPFVTPAMLAEVFFNVMRHRFVCAFDPVADTAYRQRILEDAFTGDGLVVSIDVPT